MADSGGFNFSQELEADLNQTYDSGLCFSDSQSLTQAPSLASFASQGEQIVPSSLWSATKRKQIPKWTKGLLKTSEESQKLKVFDALLKRHEEEYNVMKNGLNDLLKRCDQSDRRFPKMIKEATDHLILEQKKSFDLIKDEMKTAICDSLEKHHTRSREERESELFDLYAELKEIKDAKSSSSGGDDEDSSIIRLEKKIDALADFRGKEKEMVESRIFSHISLVLDQKFTAFKEQTVAQMKHTLKKIEDKNSSFDFLDNFEAIEPRDCSTPKQKSQLLDIRSQVERPRSSKRIFQCSAAPLGSAEESLSRKRRLLMDPSETTERDSLDFMFFDSSDDEE